MVPLNLERIYSVCVLPPAEDEGDDKPLVL